MKSDKHSGAADRRERRLDHRRAAIYGAGAALTLLLHGCGSTGGPSTFPPPESYDEGGLIVCPTEKPCEVITKPSDVKVCTDAKDSKDGKGVKNCRATVRVVPK